MPYVEKRTYSGRMLEVETYYADQTGRRITRGRNAGETPPDKAKRNADKARKQLQRLIMANFTHKDRFWTFCHRENVTEKQALAARRKLLEGLRKMYRQKGMALKYIVVTEKQGKWHHHIILNGGLPMEEIISAWGDLGRVNVSPLDDSNQYADLAKYLVGEYKQPKNSQEDGNAKEPRGKFRRRWSGSRNLTKPTVKKRPVSRIPSRAEPKPPKGYRLLPEWRNGCDGNGNWYQYYACLREEEPEAGRREK